MKEEKKEGNRQTNVSLLRKKNPRYYLHLVWCTQLTFFFFWWEQEKPVSDSFRISITRYYSSSTLAACKKSPDFWYT